MCVVHFALDEVQPPTQQGNGRKMSLWFLIAILCFIVAGLRAWKANDLTTVLLALGLAFLVLGLVYVDPHLFS